MAWKQGDVKEFLAFEKELPKVMGAGRMTLSEEDFLNYRMIEKNPALYLENPEIRRYMRMLAQREWGRLFGSSSWDVVIMAGSTGYLPYYLAAEAPAKMKFWWILIFCLTSMKNIRQDGEKPLLYLTGYMLRQIASSWETTERKTAFG